MIVRGPGLAGKLRQEMRRQATESRGLRRAALEKVWPDTDEEQGYPGLHPRTQPQAAMISQQAATCDLFQSSQVGAILVHLLMPVGWRLRAVVD